MPILFAKIVSNTNNWILPSGNKRKLNADHKAPYEIRYGFGHEEWLFNDRYLIDGYQYGHMRSLEKSRMFLDNFAERIYLYSHVGDKSPKQAYYHGYIDHVEKLNADNLHERYPTVMSVFAHN